MMKCVNCGSTDSVEPYTLTVIDVGLLQLVLRMVCRIQFQIAVWRGNQQAA